MRVAINGFGRIGRNFVRASKGGDVYSGLRQAVADADITDADGVAATWSRLKQAVAGLDVVAINDLADPETLAYLFKHDSVHGTYPGSVSLDGGDLVVDGDRFQVLSERDPSASPGPTSVWTWSSNRRVYFAPTKPCPSTSKPGPSG